MRGGEEGKGRVGWWRWGSKEEVLRPAVGTEGGDCVVGEVKDEGFAVGKAEEEWLPPLVTDASEIAGVGFVVE